MNRNDFSYEIQTLIRNLNVLGYSQAQILNRLEKESIFVSRGKLRNFMDKMGITKNESRDKK